LTTDEATPISANRFGDNGAGPDTAPEGETLAVDAVNGNSAAVNTPLSLNRGALLTVSGEGTLDEDPQALNLNRQSLERFNHTRGATRHQPPPAQPMRFPIGQHILQAR
jgi:hypothetical protein